MTDEAEHIDTSVEAGVDDSGCLLFKAEFRAEEEHEHSVHDIISEALAHVAQSRGDQPLGLVLKHRFKDLVYS